MSRPRCYTTLALLLVVGLLLLTTRRSWSCPFCTAVSQTLTEEIDAMDVVVIAELDQVLPADKSDDTLGGAGYPTASFAITRVLKGEAVLGGKKSLTAIFFGESQRGEKFLVMGVDPADLSWSTPLKLNERQLQYLLDLVRLPKEGVERLVFFMPFLEDSDTLLSGDAYDEFARTPYAVVKQLKPKLDRGQLVAWISDPDVPVSRRRLYLTLLGVCGDQRDLPLLEQRLRSSDPDAKSGLDALIACYLTLRGPEGMPLIEDLFLRDSPETPSDNYADVYAAIMALRFHGAEGDIIPRSRVLQAFSLVLDKPQMADLVIPDLARWQDWSQLDRLVQLFKSADSTITYVRMPIISYVRACPLPAAKDALEEFKQIDPEAVRRSLTFFPTIPSDPQ